MDNLINKKILVVADTLDVDRSSGGRASMALVELVNRVAPDSKVIHYSRKDMDRQGIDMNSIPENKTTLWYILAKLQGLFWKITKIPTTKYVQNLLGFSFTYKYDLKSITRALDKINSDQYDYVLALSYAASFRSHQAILNHPRWNEKLVSYIHDPYPFHNYPRPYDEVLPGWKKKDQFFKKLVDKSIAVMFPSQMLSEWMASYYPAITGKSVIIPHQLPDIKESDIPDQGLIDDTKFNVIHAGSLMEARNPTSLIEAFTSLTDEDEEFKNQSQLTLIGSGDIFKNTLDKAVKQYKNIRNIEQKMPFDKVLALQKRADVHVILEAKSAVSPFLPGKVAHALWGNNVMLLLGPYYSETRRLLGEEYPYWSENDNAAAIKTNLKTLFKKWQSDGKLELNRPDLDHYFSTAYAAEQLGSITSKKPNQA